MDAPQVDAPWTVARLLAWTRDYLHRCGVDSPRLCAEILLAHAMGCERLHLFTRYECQPDAEALAKFRAAVREASAGRPIAYIVGCKDFFSLCFEVTPDVLIPRPETEILVERTIHLVRAEGDRPIAIMDLCCGSGCIVVSLARNLKHAKLYGSDLSPAALEVARRNAAKHGVAERIEFRAGDLFSAWPDSGEPGLDVIVSNPPYVCEGDFLNLPCTIRDHEPPEALRAGVDGLDVIRRLLLDAPSRLRPEGHLLLEVGARQAPEVRHLLASRQWSDIRCYRDGAAIERVVHARWRPAVGGHP